MATISHDCISATLITHQIVEVLVLLSLLFLAECSSSSPGRGGGGRREGEGEGRGGEEGGRGGRSGGGWEVFAKAIQTRDKIKRERVREREDVETASCSSQPYLTEPAESCRGRTYLIAQQQIHELYTHLLQHGIYDYTIEVFIKPPWLLVDVVCVCGKL